MPEELRQEDRDRIRAELIEAQSWDFGAYCGYMANWSGTQVTYAATYSDSAWALRAMRSYADDILPEIVAAYGPSAGKD